MNNVSVPQLLILVIINIIIFSALRTQIKEEFNLKKLLITTVPSIKWLRHYKWGSDLIPDIMAGITIAIMHIPQGKILTIKLVGV